MEWLPSVSGLVVIAGLCAWLAWAGARDELPRNGLVGIRTRATKASDSAWYAAHRAAAPLMWVSAGAAGLAAVASAVLAVADPSAIVGAVVVGYVGAVAVLLWAAAVASRAAGRRG